jgi:hypothetical protein
VNSIKLKSTNIFTHIYVHIHICIHTYIHQKQCLIHGVNIHGARWISSTSSFQLVNTSASTHPLPLPILRLVPHYTDAAPDDVLSGVPSDVRAPQAPRDVRGGRVRTDNAEQASGSAVLQTNAERVDATVEEGSMLQTNAERVDATVEEGSMPSTGADAAQTQRHRDRGASGRDADGNEVGGDMVQGQGADEDRRRAGGGDGGTSSEESESEADSDEAGSGMEGDSGDEFDHGGYNHDEFGGSGTEYEQGRRDDSERPHGFAEGLPSEKRRNAANAKGDNGVFVPLYQTINRTSAYVCHLQLDPSLKVRIIRYKAHASNIVYIHAYRMSDLSIHPCITRQYVRYQGLLSKHLHMHIWEDLSLVCYKQGLRGAV